MKVLLLEDDELLNRAICEILENIEKCQVDTFFDGIEAYDNLNNLYDLFIIDINVPNLNGLEILKEIRKRNSKKPVIIISAKIDFDTVEKAYEIGSDDFLKKPFSIKELHYKIKKIKSNFNNRLKLNDVFSYDKDTKMLFKDDKEFFLPKKEKLMLDLLIDNDKKITTLEEIREIVYKKNDVSNEAIRTLITRLRKILGKEMIKTISGEGYKLLIFN